MTDVVRELNASAFTIPTPSPESDGTLEWDATTIVVCEVRAAGETGIGYTYSAPATAALINDLLCDVVAGTDPMATTSSWSAMVHAIRNLGRPGIASSAIVAVDIALWDLKAKVLGVSVADAIGRADDAVPAYGSGGFTSFDDAELVTQLAGWADQGLPAVKMKVGRRPDDDPRRVAVARDAVGESVELFVDANGVYTIKSALAMAERFAEQRVTWFEEPVSSDNLTGMADVRSHAPAGMDVTAGEYGYDLPYFRRMLDAGAVDCLQADVTRCAGITGFLRVVALADARCLDLSSHTAPLGERPCLLWNLASSSPRILRRPRARRGAALRRCARARRRVPVA